MVTIPVFSFFRFSFIHQIFPLYFSITILKKENVIHLRFSTLMTRCIFPVIAVLSLLGISSAAQAAGFIKFDGVDGESQDSGHEKWSDIGSFSQSIQMTTNGAAGGSSRARASVVLGDVQVTMSLDAATNALYKAAVEGSRFVDVTIDLCGADARSGARECNLEYRLENVLITSYSTAASGDNSTVQMSMSYETAQRRYLGPGLP